MAAQRFVAVLISVANSARNARQTGSRRGAVQQRNDDAFMGATVLGCECASPCTLWNADCDTMFRCEVVTNQCKHGTAQNHLLWGDWDYCVFATPSVEFESASAKFARLRREINEEIKLAPWIGGLKILNGVHKESMVTTTSLMSDRFTYERTKFVRPVGVTAPARFVAAEGHGYTGVFKGSEHVIIRLSGSQAPKEGGTIAPGVALKFLRDGKPSANMFGFVDFEGQPCSDAFFKYSMLNHVPPASGLSALVPKKFLQVSMCTQMLGLSHAAEEDGVEANFPFMLSFKGLPHVDFPCDGTGEQGFANLGAIPSGTKLMTVRAKASPHADWVVLGDIFLLDNLKTSKFGDEQLFFRHQPMEEDFAVHPEWLDQIDKSKDCGSPHVTTSVPRMEDGCDSEDLGA